MNSDSPTPVLLIAGVNRTTETRRKKAIQQELDSIEHTLRSEKSSHGLRLVPEIPQEGVYLFDHFRQFQYQHEVAVLHLSGFLNGRYLRFDGTMGEDTMDPIGFADVLARLPGLEVVFLNGPGHRELVEQLLLRDIPAVISIDSEGVSRKALRDIASRFYSELIKGANIREAWLKVQVDFAGKLVYRKVHYDLETDTLNWKGRDPNRQETDWGLYVLEDNEHRLDWALPSSSISNSGAVASSTPYSPDPPTPSRSGIKKGLFITAIIALLAAGAWFAYQYDVPQYVKGLFQAEAPCLFLNDETYNILQLPFHPPGECDQNDPTIAHSITRRLERLADTEDGEDDFQVKYLSGKCPVDQQEVEELIRTCQADVILWGEYDQSNPGEVLFHFRYLYSTGEASLDRGQINIRMPEEQLKADNDFISSGIEEVVYWARGNAHFSRQEHEKAISFLSKIREQPTDNYLRVDVRLAQSYIELGQFDKALERYNHMMAIDPDNSAIFNDRGQLFYKLKNHESALADFDQAILIRPDYADALYNRGLVYADQKQYSEAISDLQTVIRIQPSFGKPYAAMASIYGDLGDEENLYSSLERALERGEDIESLLVFFSGLRKYKQEERFGALIQKFR